MTLKWLWTEDASEFFVAGDAAWSQFVRAHVEHWCKHGGGGTLYYTISWCLDWCEMCMCTFLVAGVWVLCKVLVCKQCAKIY